MSRANYQSDEIEAYNFTNKGLVNAAYGLLPFEHENTTFNNMSEVDAKIAAAEARTDTKFAQMMGELTTLRAELNGRFDTLGTRLDHVEDATKGMRSTVIGTGIGVVAVIIAVMAYGAQWFGLGVDTQSISDQAAKNVLTQAQPRLDNMEKQIGVILTAVEALKKENTPPTPN